MFRVFWSKIHILWLICALQIHLSRAALNKTQKKKIVYTYIITPLKKNVNLIKVDGDRKNKYVFSYNFFLCVNTAIKKLMDFTLNFFLFF